jgi:hypothetical protein
MSVGPRGEADRGGIAKPACGTKFERLKEFTKEIGANLVSAIDLALNFRVRMKSMKVHDDSPPIPSDRTAFAAVRCAR